MSPEGNQRNSRGLGQGDPSVSTEKSQAPGLMQREVPDRVEMEIRTILYILFFNYISLSYITIPYNLTVSSDLIYKSLGTPYTDSQFRSKFRR